MVEPARRLLGELHRSLSMCGHPATGLLPGQSEFQAQSALNFEIFGRCLALIGNLIVLDDLPLIQTAEASLLDSGNMDKHVLSASALRLNKPVPFLRIEPLHGAASHFEVSKLIVNDSIAKVRSGMTMGPRALRPRGRIELSKFGITVDTAIWGRNVNISGTVPYELSGLFDSRHGGVPFERQQSC